MKKILFASAFAMLLFSCKKDEIINNTPIKTIADEFVGNWTVTENVSVTIGSFTANTTFSAPTAKINDTVFACIQTQRIPDPDWVGSGLISTDTFLLKPVVVSRALENNYQNKVGTYAANKDTLNFSYYFGTPTVLYIVKQKWIRK